jgi:hypothetical protein
MKKTLKSYKESLVLTNDMRGIIVGLLLGDANLQTFTSHGTTWRLRIVQGGDNHYEYIQHLREVLDPWTNMDLGTNHETTKDGKVYNKWYFNTLTFAQFAELGNAFYPLNSNNKRSKVIPSQISEWMTGESLAYWFMDDGSKKWGDKVAGVRFCSESFTREKVDLLISILFNKFGIIGTANKDSGGWRINISTKSYDKFYDLVKPHMTTSMMYKLPNKK